MTPDYFNMFVSQKPHTVSLNLKLWAHDAATK